MKAPFVGLASLGGALGLALTLLPAGSLRAQSKSPEEVPRMMVLPFRGNQKGLGPQVSEEVRQRIASDVSPKQLGVVSKSTVCANLEASGFSCDSAPDQLTARVLASQLRTEAFLEGAITKGASTYKLETRLYVTSFPDLSQPLPDAVGAKLGDLAAQVSKAFQTARRQIPPVTDCMHALKNGNVDAAIRAADSAVAIYPQSTIGRLCLANALLKKNPGSDSGLDVAARVVALDPRNKLALSILGEEYRKRGLAFRASGRPDSARVYCKKATEAWINLLVADPKNAPLVAIIVGNIGACGMAADAKPIITKAVEENPGDPDLVKLEWQILLATRDSVDVRRATVVGEDMVRVDTSAADTTYFVRQAAAYASLGEVQNAAKTVTAGLNKFPLNPSLWTLDVKVQRLAGNASASLDAAIKLVQLDSTDAQSILLLAQAQIDMQQSDQALSSIRMALRPPRGAATAPRTGVDSARVTAQAREDSVLAGKLLLVMGNQAFKAANAANPKRRDDYKRAVAILSFADSVTPTPQAKFLKGLAAFHAGDLVMRENDKAKKCDLAREAQDYFLMAQVSIPAGGSVDPKIAGTYIGYLQQDAPVADAQAKKFCR